jgi:hypothetical protein
LSDAVEKIAMCESTANEKRTYLVRFPVRQFRYGDMAPDK